ncbi:hypothetical protein [Nonomuraea rubra]|uniref:Uncharacterized protein n=1 Tax=Nonomuraea rubra TaxID=46180 RepID=A0A7X0U3B9_9ACTN|nr:hypothetical protein [Nonomuraea rubra]MBB6553305.1 hypothetical protein [Nonomuraea rubra]
MTDWRPYHRYTGNAARIRGICCCDTYQFLCEGGQYVILRRNSLGDLEETARGCHPRARAVWMQLLLMHAEKCQRGNPKMDLWL